MAIFEITQTGLNPVAETRFDAEGLRERADIQRLVRENINVLEDGLMVIAEEFGEWMDSSRRIDLLCLDADANLVVVELKRTVDGGHMELQAIRFSFGTGRDAENKRAFHALKADQAQIEQAFGEPLDWQELPNRSGCRIRKVYPGGYRSPAEEWPALHRTLVAAMIRLHGAFAGRTGRCNSRLGGQFESVSRVGSFVRLALRVRCRNRADSNCAPSCFRLR